MIQAEPRLETCPHCVGKGRINQLTHRTFYGYQIAERITCPVCRGSKEVISSQDSSNRILLSRERKLSPV